MPRIIIKLAVLAMPWLLAATAGAKIQELSDELRREALDREVFLEDGQVVELRLGPMVTSNVFQAGHRIRLEVSSSNFPRYARNLNDGGNNARATKPVVAANTVHYGADSPSRIVLTTVPR